MRRRGGVNRLTIAVVAIVVLSFGVYICFTKRIPFLHGYRFSADFASSNQLVPGFSPVRIAGVTVGKVVKIESGPGNTSKVTMQVKDEALPLHRDATVRIRPRLFLEGGFAVELNPGSPSTSKLPDGGTLPQDQTAGPVQLHQILSAFDLNTRGDFQHVIADFDQALKHGGAEALGKTFHPLGPVLRDTAQIAEAARGVHPHDASATIEGTSKIVGALASREAQLRSLVGALARTTAATASRDVQLAGSIRAIDRLVSDAPGQIGRINQTLPSVDRFVSDLRPSLRKLPPVLDDTIPFLRQTQGLVSKHELPALLTGLTPAVNTLEPLEGRLDQLFPRVTPVSDCVRDRAIPVLNSEVPDGSLSTGRPAYQDLVHAMVGLSSASQDFDGNGFMIRYQAGAGETSVGTGQVPGLGVLTGQAQEPIVGSRPTYLGPGTDMTPFERPDQPCTKQALVDLTQRTNGGAAAAAETRSAKVKPVAVPKFRATHLRAQTKVIDKALSKLPKVEGVTK